MAATAGVAGQKADDARKRLTAALAMAKGAYSHVRDNVVDGKARPFDEASL